MTLLKKRLAATDAKLKEINVFKASQQAESKARRQTYLQNKKDHARRIVLAGEAVLNAVDSGRWSEDAFRELMNEALHRPIDRSLFNLDN